MHRIIALVVLFLLLSAKQIWPYQGEKGRFLTESLQGTEVQHGAVFVFQCEWQTAVLYRATLVFAVGSTKGILIEAEDGFVVNLADVNLESHGLRLIETNGGVYSYARVHKLVNELAGYKFKLLTPFTVKDLESVRSTEVCAKKDGKDLDPEIEQEISNSILRSKEK